MVTDSHPQPQPEPHADDPSGPDAVRGGEIPPRDPGKPSQGGRRLDLGAMLAAWVVIVLAAGLWMAKPGATPEDGSETPAETVPTGLLLDPQDELAGKLTLGLDRMMAGGGAVDQAAPLAQGTTAQRVAHAILVAATRGPEPALEELGDIEPDPVADLLLPPARQAIEALDDEGSSLSQASIDLLEERLGWYGRMAAALPSPDQLDLLVTEATDALVWMLAVVGVFGLAFLGGGAGLIVLVVFMATGRLAIRLPSPSRHGVYAEAFALWMLGLLVLQFLAGWLAPADGVVLASVVAFFASLVVLAWPVLRGKPWAEVRADIGLTTPRLGDAPAGVATWAMAVPFLVVGVVLTLILTVLVQLLSGEAPQPGHPAQQAAVGAGAWQIVQLFLLAAVAAPIVEEIMFRGVLVTHLRGAARRWNDWLSFGLAAIVSSVIFAAIHPQGLVFIPPLAGLAIGFCIGRAWRGSLMPAIVAHGVSNALVMTLNVAVFAA